MSDKEARAVGAGERLDVPVPDGKGGTVVKEYYVSPIEFRVLQEIQREAIKYYKRQYLSTFADNKDLLGDSFKDIMIAKMEEAARWDVDDLPRKDAHDVSGVPITRQLRSAMEDIAGDIGEGDNAARATLSTLLDNGQVTREQVKAMTGANVRFGKVPYDTWWITAVYEGMIEFVYRSLTPRHPDLRREEVCTWPLPSIYQLARLAERVTAPAVGNT